MNINKLKNRMMRVKTKIILSIYVGVQSRFCFIINRIQRPTHL